MFELSECPLPFEPAGAGKKIRVDWRALGYMRALVLVRDGVRPADSLSETSTQRNSSKSSDGRSSTLYDGPPTKNSTSSSVDDADFLGFDHGEVPFHVTAGPGALAVFARVSPQVRTALSAPGRAYFSIKGKLKYRVDSAAVS